MKFQVDGEQVFELTESQMTLLRSRIDEDLLDADLKRRAKFIIESFREEIWKQFFQYWSQIMMNDGSQIPSNREQFITTVVSRPDYETCKQRMEKAPVKKEEV